LGFNVFNLVFERPQDFFAGEFNINIEHISQINTDDKNLFQAVFILTFNDKDKAFNLQVKGVADFKVIGEVPDDVYDSFVNINAPAIAYPYLRAFISNITLQSGMAPIIIPPLNFTKSHKKEISSETGNS